MTTLKAGQISLLVAIVGAGGMILASAFTSWATTNARVWSIEQEVSVVQEREGNHYAEMQKRLDSMDKKLDTIISQRSLNK